MTHDSGCGSDKSNFPALLKMAPPKRTNDPKHQEMILIYHDIPIYYPMIFIGISLSCIRHKKVFSAEALAPRDVGDRWSLHQALVHPPRVLSTYQGRANSDYKMVSKLNAWHVFSIFSKKSRHLKISQVSPKESLQATGFTFTPNMIPSGMYKAQSSNGSDQMEMVSTPAFARPFSTSGHTPCSFWSSLF